VDRDIEWVHSENSAQDDAWVGQEWPGHVDTVDLERSDLSPEQEARVSALYHARGALEPKVEGGVAVPVSEVVRVARWIIDGEWTS
jgi:hypothetical protein